MAFQLLGIGVNRRESADFRLYRPNGMDCYTFIHITTAAHFDLSIGGVDTEPDCCILYPPGMPHRYEARGGVFDNSYYHIVDDALFAQLPRWGIPVGTPFALPQSGFIPRQLAQMERTALLQEPFYLDLLRGQTQCLMARVAQQLTAAPRADYTPYQQHLLEQFRALRLHILSTYARPWQVSEMAEMAHLSPSRFSLHYQRFFGVSPMQDLIGQRIHQAQLLLSNQSLSVEQVALMTGYRSVYHFIRQFRAQTQITPGRYRAQHAAQS